MTVTRRDILEDASARDKFVDGVKRLKQEVSAPGRPSTYDSFVIWHHQAMMRMTPPSQNLRNSAHVGPVFPPWHRFMLIAFERQLQRILNDANFGLPYWRWNRDGDMPLSQQTASALWAADCLGGDGDPVGSGPFAFDASNPSSWRVRVQATSSGALQRVNRGLRRSFTADVPDLPNTAQVRAVLGFGTYDAAPWLNTSAGTFRNVLEGWRPDPPHLHNRVHVWIGGDMSASTSPNDPVFFLNHANVDRIWAAWQAQHNNAPYLPGANAPATLRGHRLRDRMYSVFPNPPTPADMLNVDEIYRYDAFDDLM
jgi:tyrosinase